MEASRTKTGSSAAEPPESALPPDAPDALKRVEDEVPENYTNVEEDKALDYLVGMAGEEILFDVPVTLETPEGKKSITWVLKTLPYERIQTIENENKTGDGPWAELDEQRTAAELVAAATVSPEIRSVKFRTPSKPSAKNPNRDPDADPADSLLRAFVYQMGVLISLGGEIRRLGGFSGDKVGQAKRSLVKAAGNSSG